MSEAAIAPPGPAWQALAASLDRWPDAALLLDAEGRVRQANAAALRQWRCGAEVLVGQPAQRLLAGLRRPGDGAPLLPGAPPHTQRQPVSGSGEDAEGRRLLLRCLPLAEAAAQPGGWLLLLLAAPLPEAAGPQEAALAFLRHDARQSATTVLAMLDLARHDPGCFAEGALLAAIERETRAGLERGERLVAELQARAQPTQFEPLDLSALLRLAIDGAWLAARRQGVALLARLPSAPAPCVGDRRLLAAALDALLEDALRQAPPGATLQCALAADGGWWRVALQLPGADIALPLQSSLAATAAQRHGGSLALHPSADGGSGLTLSLPIPQAAPGAPSLAPPPE